MTEGGQVRAQIFGEDTSEAEKKRMLGEGCTIVQDVYGERVECKKNNPKKLWLYTSN